MDELGASGVDGEGSGTATTFVLPTKTSRSCTECTRRKTKCDRLQPCGACVKRGQAHACVTKQSTRKAPEPTIALDERRQAALSELQLFRSTLQSLEARLPQIEFFIANAAPAGSQTSAVDVNGINVATGSEGNAMSTEGARDDSARARLIEDKLDRIARTFGNPITSLHSGPHDSGSRTTPFMPTSSFEGPLRKKYKQDHDSGDAQDDENEAVEASVNLEFMALGRPRNGEDRHRVSTAGAQYPDAAALLAAAPTFDEEEVILSRGAHFGWHHSVVHAPMFARQLQEFWDLGEDRFERASSAWLSLYFAMLAVSTKLLDEEEQLALGWSEGTFSGRHDTDGVVADFLSQWMAEQTAETATKYFDCCVSCLYRQNFLASYDSGVDALPPVFALQAIALLVIGGRDTGSAALIANLLASGLSVAQDLNLHRLCSDADFEAQTKAHPIEIRSRALIEREMQKRTLYALCYSDWFSAPFRSSWILGRARIKTPLPLNCTDEDLERGTVVNRPMTQYTNVSWLLMYINLATCMQVAFEHSSGGKTGEVNYDAFLQIDNQLEKILSELPPWLKKSSDPSGAPRDQVEMMRSVFHITAQHKILSIHRPFLAKKNKAAYSISRRRVVTAARAILQEAPKVRRNRIWTVIYHLSVALFSITLELFEQVKQPTAEAAAMRGETDAAIQVLQELRGSSSIADRGLQLVTPLLKEERKLSDEAAKKRARKRKSTCISRPATSELAGESSSAAVSSATSAPTTAAPASTVTTPGSEASATAQSSVGANANSGPAVASPEIPSWYLGDDNWLDDQLTGAQPATPASFDVSTSSAMFPTSMPSHLAPMHAGVYPPGGYMYGIVPLSTMSHPQHMTMTPPFGLMYPPSYPTHWPEQ
ncbi:hypothetical protein OIO90_004408 [Microbotryomycetes sp. JL221]|nr:hypothetical protein OIO90_004408 [Microbotryomycetes sp. JL221]